MRLGLIIFLMVTLSGCVTAPRPVARTTAIPSAAGIHHTVRSGETLWSISKMYGVDLDSLLRANSISETAVIEKGQVLVIPGATETKIAPKTSYAYESFAWPVRGYIISSFGSKVDRIVNKGIDIKAAEGTSVRASRSGRVVYSDPYLKGFGKTLIIDHGDNYQTVYSYNSDIIAKVGDRVEQDQVIAKVGRTGRTREPALHFEIRKRGMSQNPFYYLPR